MKSSLIFVLAVLGIALGDADAASQEADSLSFARLELVWNDAHLQGDTTALAYLWGDDLRVEVPEMPVMSKDEALAFWRTGRSNITAYRTSGIQVQVERDSVVVWGRLFRERNFDGRVVSDDWRFLKVYRWLEGHWRVTLYRAWLGTSAHLQRHGPSRLTAASRGGAGGQRRARTIAAVRLRINFEVHHGLVAM